MDREAMREGRLQGWFAVLILFIIAGILILKGMNLTTPAFVLGGDSDLNDYYLFLGKNLNRDFLGVLWKILPIILILCFIEMFAMKGDRNKYLLCNLTCILNVGIWLGYMLTVIIISKTIFLEYIVFCIPLVFSIIIMINNIKTYKTANVDNFPRGNGKSMPYIIVILIVWLIWVAFNLYNSVIVMSKHYTYNYYIYDTYKTCQGLLEDKGLNVIEMNLYCPNGNTYTTEEIEEGMEQMREGKGIPDIINQCMEDWQDTVELMHRDDYASELYYYLREKGENMNELDEQELQSICEEVYEDIQDK